MMNKLFVNFFIFICIATALLILAGMTLPAFAQVTPAPGNPCPGGEPCNPEEVPITGIEWLLIIGGLFGFKKIYQKFKNN